MPHCIIEHANDLTDLISPEEMMNAALKAMQTSELFEVDDIKIRTKDYAYFQTGNNRENFIHVTLKILTGRSTQQKQNLATLVSNSMANLPAFGFEITVDVQEMDSDCYLKIKNWKSESGEGGNLFSY